MGNRGKMLLMVQAIEKQHTAVVLLYLILGSCFCYLYGPPRTLYPVYQQDLEAVQNISEGNQKAQRNTPQDRCDR